MEELESKLGSLLQNPQLMQQIMSLAQNFQNEPPQPPAQDLPAEFDFATIQKLTSVIGKAGIDSQQQTLLQALRPYLSSQRIQKLEKAMRAAKLANMASAFLNPTGR